MKRPLKILGQQGHCLYARHERLGNLWYRILPDGKWSPVAH